MRLPGAKVLITGATGGLGQAIAAAVHERGARLILTGRHEQTLAEMSERFGAESVACDLRDRDDLLALARHHSDTDVMILNAGVPAGGRIGEHAPAAIDAALDVNLRAPMILARMASAEMASRGGGHIVFMSSLAGKAASPGGSVYSATKYGLRGFSLALREDLKPHSVGVSCVFPGFIRDAGMFAYSGAKLPRYVGTKTPEEVAAAVISAIEHDRAEIDVAPLGLRAAAALAGLAPEVVARIQRRLGAADFSSELSRGQATALTKPERATS